MHKILLLSKSQIERLFSSLYLLIIFSPTFNQFKIKISSFILLLTKNKALFLIKNENDLWHLKDLFSAVH